MSTTEAVPQPTSSVLTRERIEAAIAKLQHVHQIMIRLLLLQYLDPTIEDIVFMARERSEPQMRAGSKVGGMAPSPERILGLPKEWVTAVENRVKQYVTQLRGHRTRLDVQITFLGEYLEGLELELQAVECLLATECEITKESLEEMRAQARMAAVSYALKKLANRLEKQTIEEPDYLRERLALELQAHLRRASRFRKRLVQATQERQALLMSSLSDEHLATIWSIAKGPILERRMKAIPKFLDALSAEMKVTARDDQFAAAMKAGIGNRLAGGNKNEGIGSQPLVIATDPWSRMIQLLAAEPTTPLTPKPCEHDAGGRAFTGRLKSLALYILGEEDEAKLWAQTVQCLHCLNRLRALQQEGAVIGLPLENVVERVKTRTAMPRKEEPVAAEAAPPPETQGLTVEEQLRPWIGDDAGQAGAKSWW